jgi:hypothetical protein
MNTSAAALLAPASVPACRPYERPSNNSILVCRTIGLGGTLRNMARVGDEFKARCLRWAGPVGPFNTYEEDLELKESFAKRLDLSELRDCLLEVASWTPDVAFEDLATSAFDFAGILHRVGRGHELGQEILELLTPRGPALLVSMWGEARQPDQTPALLNKLDVPNASAALQIALAGALGSVKGAVALDTMRVLNGQARSPEAASEIQIALRNIEDPAVG